MQNFTLCAWHSVVQMGVLLVTKVAAEGGGGLVPIGANWEVFLVEKMGRRGGGLQNGTDWGVFW